ncbi:hypothetical protein Psal006b_02682 [Piscirickettsia salmonis]|uniref:Kinase domain protein n=1 Tax=Piscirickettsia salmonis TaxID=1238 RepID=A0AAC8VG16_PISSA|nr:kinase domain protein [Piscirickettsia salmonis]QGN99663.1 hypothetical protein Psal006b_02682 [Piscirickettsia salmonis]QGO03314.1 hypothetical protein Psal008_02714 [Piscirickettsia salmonis]QGO13945.1 hypothetical protein Psal010b_02676 [Piscirickettsia salmonis]QGO21041.1 hypothetical protein Psal013_02718 [Piscirickettsia salmonis]
MQNTYRGSDAYEKSKELEESKGRGKNKEAELKESSPELRFVQCKVIILEQLRPMVAEKKDLKAAWAEKKALKVGQETKEAAKVEVLHLGREEEEAQKNMHTTGETALIKAEAQTLFEDIENILKEIIKILDSKLKEFSDRFLWVEINKLKLSRGVVEKIFANPEPFKTSYQLLKEISFNKNKNIILKAFDNPNRFINSYNFLKDAGLNTRSHVRVMLDEGECFEQSSESVSSLELMSKNNEIAALKAQLGSRDAEIAALKAALKESQETSINLQKKVGIKNTQILGLQNQVEVQNDQIDGLQKCVKERGRLEEASAAVASGFSTEGALGDDSGGDVQNKSPENEGSPWVFRQQHDVREQASSSEEAEAHDVVVRHTTL